MSADLTSQISDFQKNWNWKSEPNQLHPQLINVLSLNPFEGTDSSPRKQMYGASHITQTLPIKHPTPRRYMTGSEMRYGMGTFKKMFEKNSEVLTVIEYYDTTQRDINAITVNPETIVIYEDDDTGTIDYMTLTDYCSHHPAFGFNYKNTPEGEKLRRGILPQDRSFSSGAILQDSPSVMSDGNYCYGLEGNVAFMTLPATAEDGIIISKSFAKKMGYYSYERRRVTYGTNQIPLNIYGGTTGKYKIHPDIGEKVNDAGVLMALRSYDSDTRVIAGSQRFLKDKIFDATFAPIDMSRKALKEVSQLFDTQVFAPPGGEVISIKVIHDNSQMMKSPLMVNEQPLKYDKARRKYYKRVYDFYKELERKRKTRLKMSEGFAILIKDCIAVLNEDRETMVMKTENIQKTHKTVALDDITLEFVIRYEHTPIIGGKGSDCHGGKGVFCNIWEDEDMPVDEWGNRSDIVFDPYSVVGRMNLGRFYEQLFNASRRDLTRDLHDLLGIKYINEEWKSISQLEKAKVIEQVRNKSNPALEAWIQRYIRFTEIMRPEQAVWLRNYANDRSRFAFHMVTVLEVGIYIQFPSNNSVELPEAVEAVRNEFPPRMSTVKFRGATGALRTSKQKVLIASMYFILLEKTGSDWTAVSSARLQNNGVISQVTNADKHSSPVKTKSIRFIGETEYRIIMAYIGAMNAAELMDRNNNIASHTFAVNNILGSEYPTRIEELVDRKQIPLGTLRPVTMIKHYGYCAGWEYKYVPYVETAQRVSVNFQ